MRPGPAAPPRTGSTNALHWRAVTDPQRILLIKPSSLGDIVHALPVLAALRRRWPRAHIAWLVGDAFAPLLDGHPLLDEVIRFDRRRFGRMWYSPAAFVAFWRFVAQVRRRRFELVVDLQGLIRSGLLAWFSGAGRRVGFAAAREGAWLFYTQRVRCPAQARHAVDRNRCVADALGLEREPPGAPLAFPLAVSDAERAAARRLLADAGLPPGADVLAVLPGARWPSKQWPAERFAELIDLVDDGRRRTVLLGAPDERALGARIAAACATAPLNLIGRTSLRDLVAVLSLAQRVVCCDSGPMHIAAALHRPLVAIFGPTDPARTGPYSPAARVVRRDLPCMPCLRRTCPLGHHACLRELSAETVAGALRALDVSRIPDASPCTK